MKIIRTKNKKEEGQALVEFALILPIFLLLVVAIIDFGWIFYNTSRMTNAAREAARIIAVDEAADIGSLKSSVRSNLTESIYVGDSVTVTIERKENGGDGYPVAKAYVSGRLKPLTGLLGDSFQNISANAYMRLEYKYTAPTDGE